MKFAYIYSRNEGSLPLAEAEACHLTNGTILECGIVVGSKIKDVSRAAYVSAGGKLLAHAKELQDLCEQVRALQITADNFKIISVPIPRQKKGDFHAILAVANEIEGTANLRNPENLFLLTVTDNGFCLIHAEEEMEKPWLRFKHKPFPFCNAIPVDIAQATLNMVDNDVQTILDPCCGSGTIALLAADAGFKTLAGDMSWPNMNISRNNIRHYDLPVEIVQENAIETTRKADCVFTNLPYDLYLVLADSTLIAILENVAKVAPKQVFITADDITSMLNSLNFTIKNHLVIKRHNFTRNIYFTNSEKI